MNILAKMISWVKSRRKDIFLGFCILLVAVIGYNLGKINTPQKTPANTSSGNIENQIQAVNPANKQATPSASAKPTDPRVVVSKASTSKKYHFIWCPGALKIKETNKLWFANESAAKTAGYTLAGNCQ